MCSSSGHLAKKHLLAEWEGLVLAERTHNYIQVIIDQALWVWLQLVGVASAFCAHGNGENEL